MNRLINLSQIVASFLKAFKKLWWIMVAFMIVFAVLGYRSYKKHYVPSYETKATFSITAPQYDGSEDKTYTNNSQLASILSVSFGYLINNELFYEIIKQDLGVNYVRINWNVYWSNSKYCLCLFCKNN